MPSVPANPTVEWLFVVVLLGIFAGSAWLIRWLFKQVISSANQRSEDFREALNLERKRSELLEGRLAVTNDVAVAAARLLDNLPDPRGGAA